MSIHVYGAILTGYGTAANNRGENAGNIATLQKLVWNGKVHSTVSAEAIRFALRRRLAESESCNRTYNDDLRKNEWKDHEFKRWSEDAKDPVFIDDDLLGFMSAEAAKDDASDGEGSEVAVAEAAPEPTGAKRSAKPRRKGTTTARRAVLEVTRSVSLTPWHGDAAFNVASPLATASAAKKGKDNPVPYGVEMHATRYQYGFAMTPAQLRVSAALKGVELNAAQAKRAAVAVHGLCALGEVAGNHGRFLFDFSPESVVFRVTEDPAPRILYVFEAREDGAIGVSELLRKVSAGDVQASELILGGAVVKGLDDDARKILKQASLHDGVLAAYHALKSELMRLMGCESTGSAS
jgi:CRISPR-associated protein Cst2